MAWVPGALRGLRRLLVTVVLVAAPIVAGVVAFALARNQSPIDLVRHWLDRLAP
jgi:hypothetical protein